MLFSRATKKGAGIEVYGDFNDLDSLLMTIYHLTDNAVLATEGVENFVLGLAYEVRHASQGDRLVVDEENGPERSSTYFGFRYIWPYFLVQLSLLRKSITNQKVNHEHMSNIYRLEHIALMALVDLDPKMASKVFGFLPKLAEADKKDYLFNFIDYVTYEFLFDLKRKRDRVDDLSRLLEEIHPESEDYLEFAAKVKKEAIRLNCKPHEVVFYPDWPEIKW